MVVNGEPSNTKPSAKTCIFEQMICYHISSRYDFDLLIFRLTRCSAIAERPRCRVRYSFRQK